MFKSLKKGNRILLYIELALLLAIVSMVGFGVWRFGTDTKTVHTDALLQKGREAAENYDYDGAIAYYQKAMQVDMTRSDIYQSLSDVYLLMKNKEQAANELFQGYTITESTELLDEYCALMLNDEVEKVNDGTATLQTALDMIPVLEKASQSRIVTDTLVNAQPYVTDVRNDRGENILFWTEDDHEDAFVTYESILRRMLAVYKVQPSEDLAHTILTYAIPFSDKARIRLQDLEDYEQILRQVIETLNFQTPEDLPEELVPVDALAVCIKEQIETHKSFAWILGELNESNYAVVPSFMVSSTFENYRRQISDVPNPQKVFVSDEGIVVETPDELSYTAHFLNFDEYQATDGVITVWPDTLLETGNTTVRMTYEASNYWHTEYPHTTYLFSYQTDPEMTGDPRDEDQYAFRLILTKKSTSRDESSVIMENWNGKLTSEE